MKKRLLIIERLDLISFLYLIGHWRQIEEAVYLSESRFWCSRLGQRLLNQLGKLWRCENTDFPSTYFEVNQEAIVNVSEKFYASNRDGNVFIDFILSFKNHELVEKAIKKKLLRSYIWRRVKTFLLLKKLVESKPDYAVTFLPHDNVDLSAFLSSNDALSQRVDWVPKSIKFVNSVKETLGKMAILLYTHWLLFLLIFQRGISWNIPKVQKFKIGFDVMKAARFSEEGPYLHEFIYDDDLFQPDKILHVISGSFPNENSKKGFEERGYPYAETGKIRIPWSYFWRRMIGSLYPKMIKLGIASLFSSSTPTLYFKPVYTVARTIIENELFYSHYYVEVFIGRDESQHTHIIRTLLLNELGGRTIGYPRGDYGGPEPEITYVCMNYFCIWGEATQSLYWHNSIDYFEVIGAGFPGLDRTYNLLSEAIIPAKYEHIKQNYKVLIALGTSFAPDKCALIPDVWITKKMVLLFYRVISELVDKYDDLFVILKPKGNELTDEEFVRLINGRDRVTFEKKISTYEMLAVSDFAICIPPSAIGIEAMMANRKVLFFDVGNAGNVAYFREYDERLVSDTVEDLEKNVSWLLENGSYVPDPVLKVIKDERGHKFDGKTIKRFKQVVARAL